MCSTYCFLQTWSYIPSSSEAWERFVHTHMVKEIILSPNAGPDNELSCSASAVMPHLNFAALYQSPLLQSLAGYQMKVTFNVLEYQYFVTWLVGPVQTL